jgi:peptidyl-prolyl cis-trans isomerase B (cyclophilin B)
MYLFTKNDRWFQSRRGWMAVLFILVACCGFSLEGLCQGADQTVILETTRGRIVMRVFNSLVPYTAGHFLKLVDSGFYDNLSFHRVENWVVQGGDPNGNGSGNYIDPNTGQPQFLRLECHPRLGHNQAGMVAMARSKNPNSASCQFYILKRPMPQLNGQYAVFGRVISGASAVMSMRPGDRIISASIYSGGGPRGEAVAPEDEAVPGASRLPSQQPAREQAPAPQNAVQPEEVQHYRRFKKNVTQTAPVAVQQPVQPTVPKVQESGF